jgi:hypothetical protein
LRKERDPKSKSAKLEDGDKKDKQGAVHRFKAGDRELRMGRALGQSATPQEALLKRCAHFTLDFENADHVAHADEACDLIKATRERDLEDAEKDLYEAIGTGADLHRHLLKDAQGRRAYEDDDAERKRWCDWVQDVFHPRTAIDPDVAETVQRIARDCGLDDGRPLSSTRTKSDQSAEFKEFMSELGHSYSEAGRKDQTWRMRVQVTALRKLQKELAVRIRSLRFYNTVRDVQSGIIDPTTSVSSSHAVEGADEPLAVLSCCGHTGPLSLVLERARRQLCIETDCNAAVRLTSVVKCETLVGEQTHTVFGTKLEQIVDCVKTLPRADRVLVFVQFPDLLDKVGEALRGHDVKCLTVTGTANSRSNTIQNFQTGEDKARVLLLNLGDASASGRPDRSLRWIARSTSRRRQPDHRKPRHLRQPALTGPGQVRRVRDAGHRPHSTVRAL